LNQSTRILLIFAGVFIAAAIVLFFIVPRQSKSTSTETQMPPIGATTDSMMNVERAQIEQLKKVVEQDPKNTNHLIQLGNLYFDMSQPQEAITYYERALSNDSLNPLVLTDCGIMYSQIGQADKALINFDKAIALKPDLQQAYFNKGLILFSSKNDKTNAIKTWRQYIALIPDTAQANAFKHQVDSLESAP
jgi:tetratricopeptide (TPR) repeat protein